MIKKSELVNTVKLAEISSNVVIKMIDKGLVKEQAEVYKALKTILKIIDIDSEITTSWIGGITEDEVNVRIEELQSKMARKE